MTVNYLKFLESLELCFGYVLINNQITGKITKHFWVIYGKLNYQKLTEIFKNFRIEFRII